MASTAAAPAAEAPRALKILSWNVAGIVPILSILKAGPHKTLENWMQHHGLDIVCFQEAKVSRETLKLAGPNIDCVGRCGGESYESFWASSTKRLGHAGVVTFARGPFSPVSCDDAPLGDADLDSEGRCVVTDHGSFYVVNVYVPWGGERDSDMRYVDPDKGTHKLRFLTLLGDACRRLREAKPVVLAGDMNIGMDPLDVYPGRRTPKGIGYSKEEQEWLGALMGRQGGGTPGGEGGGGGGGSGAGSSGGAGDARAEQQQGHFVDAWRVAHPLAEVYSCFEQKTMARARNEGSRIDYILVSGGRFFEECVGSSALAQQDPPALAAAAAAAAEPQGGEGASAPAASSAAVTAAWAPRVSLEAAAALCHPGVAIVETPQHWSDHLALLLVCKAVRPPHPHKPCEKSSKRLYPPLGQSIQGLFANARKRDLTEAEGKEASASGSSSSSSSSSSSGGGGGGSTSSGGGANKRPALGGKPKGPLDAFLKK